MRPRAGGAVPRVGLRAFLDLDRVDLVWLLVLVVGSFVLRFGSPFFPNVVSHPLTQAPVTAWGVGYPYNGDAPIPDVPVDGHGNITHGNQPPQTHNGFVFDEVYFPIDAAKDLHQPAVDYFDPEPPLAKLLMAPPIAWLGFGTWSWRITCTIAGSLLVGVVYLIARRLRRERFFAVAAATMVSLDGLEFVESRTGVIDIIAIFFAICITYGFLLHWQARTRTQWRATLYGLAVITGLAFGAKLTALAPALVASVLILGRFLEPLAVRLVPALRGVAGPGEGEARMWRDAAGGRRAALHYVAALLLAGSVFAACYSRYLTIPHDTVYHFVSCDPKTGLRDGPNPKDDHQDVPVARHADGSWVTIGGLPVPSIPTAIGNIAGQVKASLNYHDIECRPHPYASRWYTWPVMSHPVLFYADYTHHTTGGGSPETAWITDQGNPAVWWPAIPALLFCVWVMSRGPQWWRVVIGAVLVAGLGLMIRYFKAAETGIVAVHPRMAPFALGLALMVVFGVLTVICAVVSRRLVPALCVLGYCAAWLMWVLGNEKRVLFFYHMLGALPFMALAYAYALTALRRIHISVGNRSVSLAPLSYAALGLVVAGFIFFYPMWTGLPLTSADHQMRLWVGDWQ
jgi:C-terminal four TMM region of protein-O-mannosyltransferase/Dolichyl-phosphate-mannose-protein mannosyltransferase